MCRVTGVGSLSYWADRGEEAKEKNVGSSYFMRCDVAHGMPCIVEQPVRDVYARMLSLAYCHPRLQYWELIRRLLGVSCPFSNVDIPQNAMLLQAPIRQSLQDFELYFDPGVWPSTFLLFPFSEPYLPFTSLCYDAEN